MGCSRAVLVNVYLLALWKTNALICSICYKLLWCKYCHHGCFKLPSWCHWRISWEERGTISSHEPTWAKCRAPLCVPWHETLQGVSLPLHLAVKATLLTSPPKFSITGGRCPPPGLFPLLYSLSASEFWLNSPSSRPLQSLSTCPFPNPLVIQVIYSERSSLTTLSDFATP